jgi:IclR family acetate operon transcriptional repressor
MYVQSVGRALNLFMLVATGATDGSVTAIAAAAKLPAPTVHHLLSTLVQDGFLAKNEHARYSMGPKVDLVTQIANQRMSLPEYLSRALQKLATTTGETSYVAAWRAGEIKILGSIEGTHPVHVSVPAGDYLDAHARATGKALLAFSPPPVREAYLAMHLLRPVTPRTITDLSRLTEQLDEIRIQGHSSDIEEYLDGVSCISAPVLAGGVLLAAFSVSVPSQRFVQRREELTLAVRVIAEEVQAAIEPTVDRVAGSAATIT